MFCEIHIAVAALLLSLSAGTFVAMWLSQQTVVCKKTTKGVGLIVMLVSILGLVCVGYNTIKGTACGNCQDDKMGQKMMKMRGGMGSGMGPGMAGHPPINMPTQKMGTEAPKTGADKPAEASGQ